MRHPTPFSHYAMDGTGSSRQVQYPVDLGRFTSSQASTTRQPALGPHKSACGHQAACAVQSCLVLCERGWQGSVAALIRQPTPSCMAACSMSAWVGSRAGRNTAFLALSRSADPKKDSVEIPTTWARHTRQIPILQWAADEREDKLLKSQGQGQAVPGPRVLRLPLQAGNSTGVTICSRARCFDGQGCPACRLTFTSRSRDPTTRTAELCGRSMRSCWSEPGSSLGSCANSRCMAGCTGRTASRRQVLLSSCLWWQWSGLLCKLPFVLARALEWVSIDSRALAFAQAACQHAKFMAQGDSLCR